MISSFEFKVPGRPLPRQLIGLRGSSFGVEFSIYKETSLGWVQEGYGGMAYLFLSDLENLVNVGLLPEDAYRWACAFQLEATL